MCANGSASGCGAGSAPAMYARKMGRFAAPFAALAAAGAAVLVLFGPALVGSRVLGSDDVVLFAPPFTSSSSAHLEQRPSNAALNDAVYVFRPEMRLVRAAVRDGRLPTWNAASGGGRPLLAFQQVAPLYPLNWLSDIVSFRRSLAVVAAFKLLLAVTGMAVFLRRLFLRPSAVVLGSVAFGLSTVTVNFLEHPHTNVLILLPWGLAAVDRAMRSPGVTSVAILAAVVGLQVLGGHPETLAMCTLLLVAYALFRVLDADRSGLRNAQLGTVGTGLVLGVAVGAVMELPLLELARESARFTRGAQPIPLKGMIGFAMPEFWGRPDKTAFAAPVSYPGMAMYIGAVPIVFAAVGATVRPGRTARFFAAVLLVCIAAGAHTPVVAAAARAVPGLNRLNLFYLLFIAVFCVSVLAAFGLERLATTPHARRSVVTLVVAALAPLVAVATTPGLLGHLPDATRQLPALARDVPSAATAHAAAALRWGILAGFAVVLGALFVRRRAWLPALGVVAIVVTCADLVSVNRGFQPVVPIRAAEPAIPPSLAWVQAHVGDSRVAGQEESLGASLAASYGLRDLRGQDLPLLRRYRDVVYGLGATPARIGDHRPLVDLRDPSVLRLLDLFAVRYIFEPTDGPRPPGMRVVFAGQRDRVLGNPSALPAAWSTTGWRSVPDERTAAALVSRTADMENLQRVPLIEGAPPGPGTAGEVTPASVTRPDDEHVQVIARGRHAGWLVLDDSYFPGWSAKIDGSEARIYAANAAFRAVRVPAGRHVVTFAYRPASVRAGGFVSIAALLVLVVLALIGVVRKWR